MTTLIRCNDLSLGYEGDVILSGLSFDVCKGDYLYIVGENGSGKTTLMKTLLGLLSPMKGQILFDASLSRSDIGYLPQQTAIQRDFPASVREIVLSGFENRRAPLPFYSKSEKKTAQENMRRMDILDLSGRCYRDLSGGQQQRVLLARALCAAKSILLLDEPVAGLDPLVTQEMYQLIEGLNREGMTIIMVSHDVGAAMRYATHILHIGKHVFFGTRDEYENSAAGRAFLLAEGGDTDDNAR
ncbi:MAG: ABC transporter ATP-binding protein [Clostridia bacterium]|nr:ABC transporter ATP-binding protein [Clostridia bacterium]